MRRLLPLVSSAVLLCVPLLSGCATLAAGDRSAGEKAGLVSVRVDAPALNRAFAGRRFALLVGIASFQDERWRPLRYAAKDAEDLAAALRDPGRGNFDAVTVLAGPGRTRKRDVLEALAALRAQATRPEDVVVVYLSSHGTLARDGRGELRRFLVTEDAEYHRVAQTALGMDALKEELEQLPSRRRVLVLASCHSGTGKSLLPPDVLAELARTKSAAPVRPLEESSRASMVLSASDWGEAAREDDSLQNDIYTHYLVEALDGRGDRNLDGAVSATEAHDWARRHTWAFTAGRQRPSAEVVEVGADPVVLAGRISRTAAPELFSYSPRLEGFTLKVDGEEKTELPGGAAVAAGARRVELTKGDAVLVSTQVAVRAGERVDLEGLLAPLTRPRAPAALSLVGGGFGLLGARGSAELVPPSWQAGVSLRFEDVLAPGWGVWLDVGGSTGERQLLPGTAGSGVTGSGVAVPFLFSGAQVGAAVPHTWRLGRVQALTGPRVAALWLRRTFQLPGATPQDVLTAAPGWMAGLAWNPVGALELSAQLQAGWALLPVQGQLEGHALGGAFAGAGWRF